MEICLPVSDGQASTGSVGPFHCVGHAHCTQVIDRLWVLGEWSIQVSDAEVRRLVLYRLVRDSVKPHAWAWHLNTYNLPYTSSTV